jgi:dienelactone hydrolase
MKHSFNRLVIQGLAASSVLALSACATVEPVRVARVEMHQIATVTLTDQQYLTDGKGGKAAMIAGELRIPTMGKDKLPAVVLLHGGLGVAGFVDDWARELNALGVATFVPDSVTGRGVDNIVKVGRLATLEDAYRSLDLLAKHPRIDANRIAVMGFSSGAHVALYSAMKRFQRTYATEGGPGFTAYLAFYPICHFGYREREDVVDKPIRIFHGTTDNIAPISACRAYVAQLSKAGKDARLYEYAGAGHVFDWVMQKEPRKVPDAQLTGKCRLEESDGGVMLNSDTGKTFTPKDACVEKGTTYVYHADAHQAAQKNVREFLVTALKLSAAGKP